MRNRFLLIAVFIMTATPAFAGEACRSAKDLVNVAQSFYGDAPQLKNVITPNIEMTLKGINGAPDPTAMLFRYEGEEHTLPIVDGKLIGLEKAAAWSKDGEMCRLVDGELAPTTEGDSVQASMNFMFKYNRTDGEFTIDELNEGAKDGSKVMKSLAPGGLGFAVPGLKAISLRPPEGVDTKPEYEFTRKDEPVRVKASPIGKTTLFRLKDIKSSKADRMTIAGDYVLNATFKFDPEDIATAEAKRVAEQATSEN